MTTAILPPPPVADEPCASFDHACKYRYATLEIHG